MFKFWGYILILVFLLTACTQDTVVPKEQEKNDDNIVVTPDGKVTFEIINNIQVPQEKVETIKGEILAAYDVILNSIHTTYIPSNRINVILNEGNLNSYGIANKIELYDIKENRYPLVHEMTHSLLGYGNNFNTSKGYFTQEGFASYMEEKHGKKAYPHKLVKYFMDSNKLVPISKLIDPNIDDSYFRPPLTNHSFVTYLIDTYGLGKFEQIYNEEDLSKKVEVIYGKNINELENDWFVFLKNGPTDLTYKEKMDMGKFFSVTSVIDNIDSKFFTKE